MKHGPIKRYRAGVSLMETVVAVSVLAIAVPLAFVAMAKGAAVGSTARAETRAPVIAERCLLEVKAARNGQSEFLPVLPPGVSFPVADEVLALGFSRNGRLLGVVDGAIFEAGAREPLEGESIRYLAKISGRFDDPEITLTVRIEHPAVRKEGDRDGVSFHTKLP